MKYSLKNIYESGEMVSNGLLVSWFIWLAEATPCYKL